MCKKELREFEIVKCECGKETPLKFAILDAGGVWTCPYCYIEILKKQHGSSLNEKIICGDYTISNYENYPSGANALWIESSEGEGFSVEIEWLFNHLM